MCLHETKEMKSHVRSDNLVVSVAIALFALACAGKAGDHSLAQSADTGTQVGGHLSLPQGPIPDTIHVLVGGRRVYHTDSLTIPNSAVHSVEIVRGDSAIARFGPSARVVVIVAIDSGALGPSSTVPPASRK
jgi:hypothetical protein